MLEHPLFPDWIHVLPIRTDHEVFSKFQLCHREVPPGFRVNFLGVKTNTSFFSEDRLYLPDQYPPVNEEYLEWIDLLEAVTSAQQSFTMIELGAGYGHWLANAAAALQHSNRLPYRLIGVEAEPTHFRWMKEHLQTNNIDLQSCQLIEAAVNAREGSVGFHTGDVGFGGPENWYGQSLGGATRVPAVTLATIIGGLDKVDLIDMDIQGAELEVMRPAASQVMIKVKRIHVATHSPQAESGLRTLFTDMGWKPVNDYAAGTKHDTEWGPIEFQDGVQTWVNPKFFSSEELEKLLRTKVPTTLGFKLCAGSEDFITKLLLADQIFEVPETDLVSRLLRPGDVCLDAGCHIGYYTCLMATLVAPAGKVYAFEANPRSCRLTEQSLGLNNLHAEVVHAALGDSRGTTAFHVSTDDQTGLSSLGEIPSLKETVVVPWLRLDDFLKDRHIDSVRLLKIDVEGAEEIVLRGLGSFLQEHVVDYILLECYDERLKMLKTSTQRIAAILREGKYLPWEFGTKAPSGWTVAQKVVSRGDCNYLFSSPRVQERMPPLSVAGAFLALARSKENAALQAMQQDLAEQKKRIQQLQSDLNLSLDEMRHKDQDLTQLRSVLRAMQNSAGWRVFNPWRRLREVVLPEGTILRRYYDLLLRPLRGSQGSQDRSGRDV